MPNSSKTGVSLRVELHAAHERRLEAAHESTTFANSSSESTQIAPKSGRDEIAQDALDEIQVAMRRDGALRCSERDLISAQVRVRNSTSVRTSSGGALAAAVRTMNPPPACLWLR